MALEDCVIALMRRYDIPVTRENYLDLAYAGVEIPHPWPAELEAELPPQLQDWPRFERAPRLPPGHRRHRRQNAAR
jgi:hypothetical protein